MFFFQANILEISSDTHQLHYITQHHFTRALLRLERTMNLLEGGKGGEGRVGERGWGGDGGRMGREGGEGMWGREGGWGVG